MSPAAGNSPRPRAARLTVEPAQGETRRAVRKGLRAYNAGHIGKRASQPVTISLRDRAGAVVGGLVAETWLDWMHVSLVWIDDAHRGGGAGSRLLAKAEEEARRLGVRHIYLDSFTFQAPDFYKKRGYREYGRLEAFPAGHARVFLTKDL
jgi:GNAT superfamily N-acetyltransferase